MQKGISIKNSLIDALKNKTFKRDSVTVTSLTSLKSAYDNLMDLGDPIIKLVVENCSMDALLHNLRVIIESPDDQIVEKNKESYAGNFSLGTRLVTIVNFGAFHDYKTLVIHELTHAVSSLAFRFDTPRFELEYKIDSKYSQFKKYLDTPSLPCSAGEQRYRDWDLLKYQTGTLSQFKYHNQTFNPAVLKFKQCVREDYAHSKNACERSGVKELDNFFEDLEARFPKGVLETDSLCEVLPIYLECRVQLFQLVKENKLTKEQAVTYLAKRLPRIHDYVETDFKNVLQLRLESYYSTVHYQGYEVQCVKLHMKPMSANQSVGTLFKRDGSLRISRDAQIVKVECEFLTKGTIHGQRVEMDEEQINNYSLK